MSKRSILAFVLAVAMLAAFPAIADDAQTIAQLQAELRVTRDQLAAANQQLAGTIAAATIQIQDLQKQIAGKNAPPVAPPTPEKK